MNKTPIEDFIKRLTIIAPEDITIRLDRKQDYLRIKLKNTIYTKVTPEKPFPVSHPNFVIMKDNTNKHICTIKNLDNLDQESRKELKMLLEKRYFIPKIEEITALDASGDKFEWETVTNHGKRRFKTRGRRSITFVESKIIIIDIQDNLYQIENVQKLDEKSRYIIESIF